MRNNLVHFDNITSTRCTLTGVQIYNIPKGKKLIIYNRCNKREKAIFLSLTDIAILVNHILLAICVTSHNEHRVLVFSHQQCFSRRMSKMFEKSYTKSNSAYSETNCFNLFYTIPVLITEYNFTFIKVTL